MTYIKTIQEDQATGKLKRTYDAGIRRTGSVANIVKMMSLDENVCTASLQFYAALMKSDNALDGATREMLATVVSNVNDCYY